jgi:hypothetical protein
MGWINTRKPSDVHKRHGKHRHLTVCGAGVSGVVIGTGGKMKHPCRMCHEGAKIR